MAHGCTCRSTPGRSPSTGTLLALRGGHARLLRRHPRPRRPHCRLQRRHPKHRTRLERREHGGLPRERARERELLQHRSPVLRLLGACRVVRLHLPRRLRGHLGVRVRPLSARRRLRFDRRRHGRRRWLVPGHRPQGLQRRHRLPVGWPVLQLSVSVHRDRRLQGRMHLRPVGHLVMRPAFVLISRVPVLPAGERGLVPLDHERRPRPRVRLRQRRGLQHAVLLYGWVHLGLHVQGLVCRRRHAHRRRGPVNTLP